VGAETEKEKAMSDYLLDTNILIRYLRKTEGFRELVTSLAGDGWLCISAITRFEVVRGMHDREREATVALLNSLETLVVSAEIADAAGELLRTWRSHGRTFDDADALIAATAIQNGLALITTNAKHFPIPEMVVYQANDTGKLTLRE
jgi:predicted nucleic acid-binding protein